MKMKPCDKRVTYTMRYEKPIEPEKRRLNLTSDEIQKIYEGIIRDEAELSKTPDSDTMLRRCDEMARYAIKLSKLCRIDIDVIRYFDHECVTMYFDSTSFDSEAKRLLGYSLHYAEGVSISRMRDAKYELSLSLECHTKESGNIDEDYVDFSYPNTFYL